MRGTPLLQAILTVVAFLLAGVPTYRLTRPAAPAASAANPDKPGASPTNSPTPATGAALDVNAIFAPAPTEFRITNLGQDVLVGHGPRAQFTGRWGAAVPPEGIDLVVHARWPARDSATAGTPSEADPRAMRIIVRFPDGLLFEKTLWAAASGEVDEVVTVPGEATTTE